MSQTVVFVHGGWVTPACWDPFVSFFEARGYRCLVNKIGVNVTLFTPLQTLEPAGVD